MRLPKEVIKLTPEDLKRYLKHDLWTIVEVSYLLTGCKPSGYNDLIFRDDIWAHQHDVYQMAKSSMTAGKIKGEGGEASFQAHPMAWIEWALSKELVIPNIFIESYQAQQETTTDQSVRSQESYRPADERIDKAVVQELGRALHTVFPECPITQLIHIPPIQARGNGRYADETILQWLKDAGVRSSNIGRPSKEEKKACLARMPEKWRSCWL